MSSKKKNKTSPMVGETGNKERKVFLMRDTVVEFPELWMEVYLTGPDMDRAGFPQMFARAECNEAKHPDEADLVVFTGGVDVNPALYGEKAHSNTYFDDERDKQDLELFKYCIENGIPMLGVCRGCQFGWAALGGKLYQDINNHNGDHEIWDVRGNFKVAPVSSVHHQAIRPATLKSAKVDILADTYGSTIRWKNDEEKDAGQNCPDIEAYWVREAAFLGVQGHPEYRGYARYTKWVLDQLMHYVVENPDIELTNNVRRLKPDLRMSADVNKLWKELA